MPSTLLPFLYQTRTILRMPPRMRMRTQTPVSLARSLHATCIRSKAHNDIPFATDVPGEDVPMETPRGTITPSERQVFERIFADIRARGLKPQPREDEPPAAQSSQSSRSAMLIMQQAAQDARQARPATIRAPSLLAGAANDRNKALLRFPPELRAAASKALDQVTSHALGTRRASGEPVNDQVAAADEEMASDEGWKAPAHNFGRTIELEAKRHPERMRVEGLIMNASTDFELWDVLEKEVFTMPARLGLGNSDGEAEEEEGEHEDNNKIEAATEAESPIQAEAEARAETEAEAGAKVEDEAPVEEPVGEASYEAEAEPVAEAETATETETQTETEPEPEPEAIAPPKKLSLYVHGPLYPAYLLLALRRLNQAYHSPSPLMFTLLPRIKELGLKSYVLGVSTPFYNELLRIYWQRRGDLNSMLGLLEEMRHCGLYFDEKTASIMDQADAAVKSMAGKDNYSAFGRALMTMPDYELSVRNRIQHWRRIIDISISQRESDFSY